MDNQSPYAVVQYVPLPSQIRSVTSPRQQLNKHKWPPPSVLSVQKFWPLDVDEHRNETGDGQIERFDQREANDDGEENRVIHEENIQFKEQANEQRFAESTDVIVDDNNADQRVHRSETLHGATERSPLNDESSRYHAKKRSFAAEVNLDLNAIQSQHLNDEIDDDIAATIISADEFGGRPKPTVRHSLLGSSASVSKSTTSSVTLTEHLPRVTISNSLSFGGNEVEHLSTGGVICQEGNPGNNHQQQQCTDANGTLSSSIARDPRPAPRLSRKPETELPRQSDGGKKKVSAKGSLNDGTDKILWHTIIKANDEGQEVMKTTTITARNETEAETTANYQRSPLAKQREVVEEQDLFTALDDKNTVNIDMPSWRYEASKWRNQHSASGSVDDATVVHADKNNKHSEDFWNAKHQFDIQSHFDREQLNESDRICGALNIDSYDRACNDDDIKSGKGDKKKSVSDDDRSYGVSDGRNNYSDTFEKLITRSGDEDEEEEEVEIPIIDIHKDSYIITSAKYHKRCDHSSRRTKERNSRRQVGDVTKRALASSGSVELSKNLTNDSLEASSKSLYRRNDCRDNDDKTAEAIVENSIPLATTPVQMRDEQNEPVHSTKYSLARQRIEEAEQQRDEDLIQIELFRRKNIERLTELSEQLAKWHDDYTATTELGMACRSYDDDAVIQSASLNNCLVAPARMASECFDAYEQATSKNHQQHEDQNRTKKGEWIKIEEELSEKVDETKAEVDKSKALSRIRGSSLEREGDENSSRKHVLRSRRRRSDGEKEMRLLDENDKRIAIASIERHQRQLHEQQQQLFELLDNAIFFLKNLDTNTLQQRSLTPQSSDFSERSTAHLDEISTSVASPSKHAALSTGRMITQQKNDEDEGKDHKDDYSAADRSMSADQQRRIGIERFPDRSTASIHNESDHHTSPASTSDHHAHHSYLETPAQTIMRAINEFSNNETLHQQLPCKTHN
ncbi:unnamed protein product [Anisakis simplex]|uniref:Uncharacterized protein n=1 Tax=Anisakis simplex TaxID=6269 RepID=A0A158PNI4_ANISI|nr:unnamed protein product [Anisakis simplex]